MIPQEYLPVIRHVADKVKEIYSKARLPPSHGFDHVARVVALSYYIGVKEGLSQRELALLLIASYLHDIGMAVKGKKKNHAMVSAEYAESILKSLLKEDDLRLILKAIREHSWERDAKPSSIISGILQDADRLDAIGAIGIARVFVFSGYSNREICCYNDPFAAKRGLDDEKYAVDHFYKKLLLLPERMNTGTGRSLARNRARTMRRFLVDLRDELELVLKADRDVRKMLIGPE